jgi:hypothetical protein
MKPKKLEPREETSNKMQAITRGDFLAIVNKAIKTPAGKHVPKSHGKANSHDHDD